LVVSDETTGFDGEEKVIGRGATPTIEGLRCGQAIRPVVQLNGVEAPDVVIQKLGIGRFGGIKRSLPMLVVKS